MKALLVRLSSIGDIVHTLPALAALAEAGFDVSWLAEAPSRELLEGHPLLARRVEPPRARAFRLGPARRALAALRAEHFDVALDFQGLWKSAAWARLSRARRVVGFAGRHRREPASGWLLGERVCPDPAAMHVIDLNLSLLRAVGVEAVGNREFPLPDSSAAAARVAAELDRIGLERFALLNPAGGWANKLWPAARYAELARELGVHGLRSLVTWGPGEESLADAVVSVSEGFAERGFPTSLLELGELARRAAVFVAADTGPLHIGCAVGAPVVGLYGPTDPARNGPFSPRDEVVRRVPPCAPCHKRSCPIHAEVMSELPVSEVLAAVERRIARGPVAG